MRIALIATGDGTPASEGGLLAGRSLARHQLDFALALGCEKVILFGHGASEEAIALRHAAEAGGAQVQVVRGVRDLPAAVRGDDLLLVMAHGLLPDSSSAFEQLKEGTAVLILPAEAGWSAGFERLDLAAAWGGAMVLPGRLVAQLDQLPEDAEPIAGLLRIARQAGVPERPLAERELAEGRWQIVRGPDAVRTVEPGWLRRRLPPLSPLQPTAWFARILVRRFASRWAASPRVAWALPAVAVALLLAAVAAARFGLPPLAFAMLVAAALAIEANDALNLLGRATFLAKTKTSSVSLAFRLIWDAALLACGVLAIDGSPAHRLFAPLVTIGLLHLFRPALVEWRALAEDRGILAAFLAIAAALGFAEAGFMVLALLLIGLCLAVPAAQRS